jgi:S1-C subfamily serine protease
MTDLDADADPTGSQPATGASDAGLTWNAAGSAAVAPMTAPPPASPTRSVSAPAAPEAAPTSAGVAAAAAGGGATGEVAAADGGSRRQRRSEWRRTERARRYAARNSVRFPIFTRSVLLWLLIFALTGLAFGASGAFWWANFNSQVSQLRSDTQDFEARSSSAASSIDAQRKKALAQIAAAAAPLSGIEAQTQVPQLAASFSPSVYVVSTLDNTGKPSVGTAFAVQSGNGTSLMLTSYTTVAAAAVAPGPAITLTKGSAQLTATLISWDPAHDLALLQIPKDGIPVLGWASDAAQSKLLGSVVFAISGTGGSGAALSPGTVIDQSTAGFRSTVALGTDFQGAPVINVDGKVVGVASLTYNPLGYDAGAVRWSTAISTACDHVLTCGGAAPPTAGKPGG